MSSPLHWFRKNQKLLLGVFGVMLMFVFTVMSGAVGINELLGILPGSGGAGGSPQREVAATWDGGTLTESELQFMRFNRMRLAAFLQRSLRTAYERGGMPMVPGIPLGDSDQALVETRLLAERARDMGLVVNDDAVLEYLLALTGSAVDTSQLVGILRSSSNQPLTQDQLFDLMREELLAQKVRLMATTGVYPRSPAAAWDFYTRLNRQVKAELMPINVADFVDEVPDPSDEELQAFFEEHKDQYAVPYSPEPGFKRRRQMDFQFVRADFNEFLDAEMAKVTDQEVEDHYQTHKDEYRETFAPDASDLDLSPAQSEPDSEKPLPLDDSSTGEAGESDDAATSTTETEGEGEPEPEATPSEPEPEATSGENDLSLFSVSSEDAGADQDGADDETAGGDEADDETADDETADDETADDDEASDDEASDDEATDEDDSESEATDEDGSDNAVDSEDDADTTEEGSEADDQVSDAAVIADEDDGVSDDEATDANVPAADEADAGASDASESVDAVADVPEPADETADSSEDEPDAAGSAEGSESVGASDETEMADAQGDASLDDADGAGIAPSDLDLDPNAPGTDDAADQEMAVAEPSTDSASTDAGDVSPDAGILNTDAADSTNEPAGEETLAPTYKPLEEVREQIRRDIAIPRAQSKMNEALSASRTETERFYKSNLVWRLTPEGERDPAKKPVPLDFASLTAKYPGLTIDSTGMVDEVSVQDHELGKLYEASYSGMPITFANVAFGEEVDTYQSRVFPQQGFGDVKFLFWKIDEKAAFVPKLETVRDEVILAWKMHEDRAVKKALEAGKKYAERAQNSEKTLVEVAADRPDSQIVEMENVSWMTTGNLSMNTGGQVYMSPIAEVEGAGNAFRETMFRLRPGQVGVAVNQPQTIVYVIRIISESPAEEVLHERFLASRAATQINRPQNNPVGNLASNENNRMLSKWYQGLLDEMGFQWARDPQGPTRSQQ